MARSSWTGLIYATLTLPVAAQDTTPSTVAAEWQAFWAAGSFWVTIASLVVSIAALCCLFASLKQTQRALGEARDLGQRQARAYVEAVDLELSSDDGDVIVICRNSGETPSPYFAVAVEARKMHSTKMYHALSHDPNPLPSKSWAALGKGAEWRAKVTPATGSQSVRELAQNGYNDEDRLLVTGAIVYQDIFDRFFKTEFAFFTHNGVRNQFLRPNGVLVAYAELSKSEASRLLRPSV